MMINPSEIKLWNYIKIDGVETELDYHVMGKLFKNSNADLLNKLEGIPITPELLDKCGFIGDDSLNDFEGYGIVLKNTGDYQEWRIDGVDCLPQKYLHQLQNILFALKGEEIIYKND